MTIIEIIDAIKTLTETIRVNSGGDSECGAFPSPNSIEVIKEANEKIRDLIKLIPATR